MEEKREWHSIAEQLYSRIPCKKNNSKSHNGREKEGWQSRRKRGIDELMSLPNIQTGDIVDQLVTYLLSDHKEEFLAAMEDKQLLPKKMDVHDVSATLGHAKIGVTQWEKIVQALKVFMDVKTVCVSMHTLRALGADHGEITTGTYDYISPKEKKKTKDPVKEVIRFWHKDVAKEYVRNIEAIINGENIDPKDIEDAKHCSGGDHATKENKGSHRFLGKSALRIKDGREFDRVYGLGDVACRKDSAEILWNTILPAMVKGMDEIAKGKLIFKQVTDENGKASWKVELVPATIKLVPCSLAV
eukprot:scaffold12818_cov85-Skeletonema_marinoi.AAC.1